MGTLIKDDINFHTFLSTQRRIQKATLEQIGRGLYSNSTMKRIELGERLPQKMQRDRIVARLGVSADGYADYLTQGEYEDWAKRQEIVHLIEKRELKKALNHLDAYSKDRQISKIEKQFVCAMRYNCYKLQGMSKDVLLSLLEEAIAYSIPMTKNKIPKNLYFSDQELNLLIEYCSLAYPLSDEKTWKKEAYSQLIDIIENSHLCGIGKSKIYPKLVLYIGRERLTYDLSSEEYVELLELCNRAIELLQDNKRMYYLVELLELRLQIIERIRKSENGDDTSFLEVEKQTSSWREVLLEMYEECDLPAYMEDFCYLYYENESFALGDVMRMRRKMLGLTRKQLAEGICSDRTIERIEMTNARPQYNILKKVFARLGLFPGYTRTRVITDSVEVLKAYDTMCQAANERIMDDWKKSLDQLEQELCMEIPQNEQFYLRSKIIFLMHTKQCTLEESIDALEKALECTIPMYAIDIKRDSYLTSEELSCINSLVIRSTGKKKEKYMKVIKEYCQKVIKDDTITSRIVLNELLMINVANSAENEKEYKQANIICKKIMKASLSYRRMMVLPQGLYILLWNDYHTPDGEHLKTDIPIVREGLKRCILLSEIEKNDFFRDFYVSVLNG